jgi:hypothetical protein
MRHVIIGILAATTGIAILSKQASVDRGSFLSQLTDFDYFTSGIAQHFVSLPIAHK